MEQKKNESHYILPKHKSHLHNNHTFPKKDKIINSNNTSAKKDKHKSTNKKDDLDITYEEYLKKKEEKENNSDYSDKYFINNNKLKFIFVFIPEQVSKYFLGINLPNLVKIIACLYTFRALSSIKEMIQIKKIYFIPFIFNFLCIITSIILYLSQIKKSINFIKACYFIYAIHFISKFFETIMYINNKIDMLLKFSLKNKIAAFCGLLCGQFINLISTWFIFCYLVYTINYQKYNELKKYK